MSLAGGGKPTFTGTWWFSAETKIRFRRARGAQPAAFAVGLGLGIDPTTALSRRAHERWNA